MIGEYRQIYESKHFLVTKYNSNSPLYDGKQVAIVLCDEDQVFEGVVTIRSIGLVQELRDLLTAVLSKQGVLS